MTIATPPPPPPPPPVPASRKLLFVERIVDVDGRAGWNGIVAGRLAGHVDPAAFRAALAKLQRRFPALASRVERRGGEAWLAEMETPPEIELRVYRRQSPDDWSARLAGELADPLDSAGGRMMRVVLLIDEAGADVIEIVHHVVCNGRTRLALFGELLRFAGDPTADPVPQRSPATIEAILGTPASAESRPRRRFRILAALIAPPFALARPLFRARRPDTPVYVLHWQIGAAADAALRKRADAEGVTPFAALAASLLHAFRAVRGRRAHNKLCCSVDLSARLPGLGPDDLLAVAGWVDLSLHDTARKGGGKTDIWADARALKSDLSERLARFDIARATIDSEAMHGLISPLIDMLIARNSYQDLTFSHLGTERLPRDHGAFRFERLLGSCAWFPWRNTCFVFGARSEGETSMFLVARETYLPRREAEAIRDHALRLLGVQTPENGGPEDAVPKDVVPKDTIPAS